ncbi:MAG: non-reducing end alpha-L-arabinofuranosidase family hydrolase [Terriglobia bacterium]
MGAKKEHRCGQKTLARLCGTLPFAGVSALTLVLAGCGSIGSGGATAQVSDSLALALSTSNVTVPQGGSIGQVTATVARSDSTGSITFSVGGLPSGATVNYTQPGTADSGVIALNPGTAAQGTYALTVSATDGVATTSASLSLVIDAGIASLLSTPITWSSTGPLAGPIPDAAHAIVSVKDPTAIYYNQQWNVYATNAYADGNWNMQYISFTDWPQAAAAQPYFIDQTTGFSGYHCAPEVFYFTPADTWYLIFQSPQPQYSTTTDPTNPASWSTPQNFFSAQPASVSAWIDFWVICDSANCYLYFAGDNGNIYRSQTAKTSFPQGFSEPQIILQDANAFNLFESDKVYALQGLNQYLLTVECIGPTGYRFFRAFIADDLGGQYTPIPDADTWTNPYAGQNNVTFPAPATDWTNDISHGEMIRVGYDETLTIDPTNLQFLCQGASPSAEASASNYSQIPYQLGLLTRSN